MPIVSHDSCISGNTRKKILAKDLKALGTDTAEIKGVFDTAKFLPDDHFFKHLTTAAMDSYVEKVQTVRDQNRVADQTLNFMPDLKSIEKHGQDMLARALAARAYMKDLVIEHLQKQERGEWLFLCKGKAEEKRTHQSSH